MIRLALTCIGAAVVALYIAGAFGIGNFRIYYGSDLPHEWCAKEQL